MFFFNSLFLYGSAKTGETLAGNLPAGLAGLLMVSRDPHRRSAPPPFVFPGFS